MSDAEQQQTQDVEPKAEDANAPINIKVSRTVQRQAEGSWPPRKFSPARELTAVFHRGRAGHDTDRRRGLLQDQEEYEAEQTARRVRQQGRQGCEQHPVSLLLLCLDYASMQLCVARLESDHPSDVAEIARSVGCEDCSASTLATPGGSA